MKMLLLGVVGVLALQALLVWGYLSVSEQGPIVLNPDRSGLVENGVMMAAFCGEGGSGKEMLDALPANRRCLLRSGSPCCRPPMYCNRASTG
jgi:hypothetical protein